MYETEERIIRSHRRPSELKNNMGKVYGKFKLPGVFLALGVILTSTFSPTPSSASMVTINGFNCIKTDRADGFSLDCTTGVQPSSSPSTSSSPSSTPTVTPSSTPSSTSPTTPPTSASPSTTSSATVQPSTPPSTTSSSPTSPSPSPSPTGPTSNLLCWNRLAACGYPDENSTGALKNVPRTPSGSLNIRAGGTFENLNVEGCIEVNTTAAVILRNIVVHANDCNGNISKHNGGQLLIEDVTSFCDNGHGHGFWVQNTTARRVRTYGCENGFELNANSLVVDSMISAQEANADGHGDGIQSQGGNDVKVRHNTILMRNPVTSAIITNPDQNLRWILEDNFFGGGAYTLYCPENGRQGWLVQNNRFIRAKTSNPFSAAYGLTDACGGSIQWINNRLDDTAQLVTP